MGKPASLELAVSELRWRCNPDRLGIETTDELDTCTDIIGQERAVDAIRLGLEIQSPGYNIYVSGLTGTGKTTTIKQLLESMRREKKALEDICYVHNFHTPEMPVALKLPAGQGTALKQALAEMLRTLREHIPKLFESDLYTDRQKRVVEELKQKRTEIAAELEKTIGEKGFRLVEVQFGPFSRPLILPLVDGQPVELDKLGALVEAGKLDKAEFERIKKDYEVLMEKMESYLKISRGLDREIVSRLASLEEEYVSPIVDTCIEEVRERFDYPKLKEFLTELREYCIDNLKLFAEEADDGKSAERAPTFVEFEVNVIVDNSRTKDVPVIIETAPRYANVFGSIDRAYDSRGEYRTDFTMISAGSILRANGGFLVLSLSDILEEPSVWPALKRALKNQQVSIHGGDALWQLWSSALKPEPIDIEVKIALIGDAEFYHILYDYDEDFKKIFKVKADFDTEMPNDQDNLRRYGEFIKNITAREKLPPFHKSAVASIAEEGARIAGRQDRLTTRFSDVADVIREASYWARKDAADVVGADHVEKAVDERIRRVSLTEDKINEMIVEGTILLDIDGAKVGQVNGLSVYDLGDYAFGKPSRITVETSMGRSGVINIEREAELSGKTHNKGVLILEGYLRRMYAQDKPLAMSASICFEQSYSGIDGDSASSTEVYGLLSSLSELPIRQDLAVTGSVNQKGEIQPIGGVNEKIHGFYDICRMTGLTGHQGVVIPRLNKRDLMLRKDVVESIEAGRFHIYAVDTIDQGIELLTGRKAGTADADGGFPDGTVHNLVNDKLERFAEALKEWGEDEEK